MRSPSPRLPKCTTPCVGRGVYQHRVTDQIAHLHTVAVAIAHAALIVSRFGSLGLAPTRVTVPGLNWFSEVMTLVGVILVD